MTITSLVEVVGKGLSGLVHETVEVVISEVGADVGVDELGWIEAVDGSMTVSGWDVVLAAFLSLRF